MANDNIKLFNFYRRYRWTETDFTNWQTGMVDHSRGMFDGLFSGGVLEGFNVAPTGGTLTVEVSAGIASGPSGFLNVINSANAIAFDSATGSQRRDLLVVRPNLVNGDYITSPTNPFVTVPLTTAQESSLVVLKGVEANSPVYPTPEANDVILCGVRVQTGQTTVERTDMDFEIRDVLGKNSIFQQNQAKYDDRCRVLRTSNTTITIKPSQTQVGQNPKNFLYINKGTPSRFPLDVSNKFNFLDTALDFSTGAITGGDAQSLDFTPSVPTIGNWIVATVSLQSDDTLNISFGTQGTRAECISAIENATTVGAGAISLPAGMLRLAFVLLYSSDGVNITELDTFDARSTLYFGGPENSKVYPNVFLSALGNGDVTTLAAAISSLPAAGGVILVMDDVIVPSQVTIPSNVKLIGRGKAVNLTFAGATGIITSDNVIVQDLNLSATGSTQIAVVNGNYNVFEKCTFNAPSGNSAAICIDVLGNGTHIGECQFTGVLSPALATGIKYEAGTTENSEEWNIFQN